MQRTSLHKSISISNNNVSKQVHCKTLERSDDI